MSRTASSPTTRKRRPARKPNSRRGGSPKIRLANYQAALKHLHEHIDLERTRAARIPRSELKLTRMRALMAALGDPQDELRIVHLAGTKGKGSVCEMAASCLGACGYAVGVYTSPHLVEIRERIRIGRQEIPTAAFTQTMTLVAEAAASIESKHGKPTFFELLTALAFCYFAEKAVDVAVIECGLGGRLDSTNIVNPDVAAITAISHDHTALLGESLEQIAQEKAGILKKGVPSITIPQDKAAMEAIRQVAEQRGADLKVIGRDIDFSCRFEGAVRQGPHTCVCLSTERSNYEHLVVPLQGEHQALNCGLALAIVDQLKALGFDIVDSKVIAGLAETTLPGRMELIRSSPRVLLDGAHNAASVKALIRSIGAHVPYDSMVVVFGCAEDKDIDGMLKHVALGADKVIFTKARRNPRAMDPHELDSRFHEVSGKMSQVAETLPEALNLAGRAVGRGDLICVTGSFFLVGEARKHLERGEASRDTAA